MIIYTDCTCGRGNPRDDENDAELMDLGHCWHDENCPVMAEFLRREDDLDPRLTCEITAVDGTDRCMFIITHAELGKLLGVQDPVAAKISLERAARYVGRALAEGRAAHDWCVG
ncbi:MAG: hypothetical protein EPN91_02300 [Salinibacterium sp.]|nr:MAG: hypothetical protein EPN91_02300 [Salinibacterium sp.]